MSNETGGIGMSTLHGMMVIGAIASIALVAGGMFDLQQGYSLQISTGLQVVIGLASLISICATAGSTMFHKKGPASNSRDES